MTKEQKKDVRDLAKQLLVAWRDAKNGHKFEVEFSRLMPELREVADSELPVEVVPRRKRPRKPARTNAAEK